MDQSTYNVLIGIVLTLVAGGIGWFARTIWDRVDKVDDKLNSFRIEVARDYVSTHDLDSALGPVKGDLTYIRNRLDMMQPPARRAGDH